MEIKQIMWVADNLEEELATANAAFESIDAVAVEHRKEVDTLRVKPPGRLRDAYN